MDNSSWSLSQTSTSSSSSTNSPPRNKGMMQLTFKNFIGCIYLKNRNLDVNICINILVSIVNCDH